MRVRESLINKILFVCKRLVKHLKLQCLKHILAFSEIKNDLITFLDTLLTIPLHMIKVGKFIHPAFFTLVFLEFLQDADALIKSDFLSRIKLVFKNKPAGVTRCNLRKFLEILYGIQDIPKLNRQFAKGVKNHSPSGVSLVGNEQYVSAVLKAPALLVKVAD